MKIVFNIVGILLLLIGGIWMLQGLNIIGGSFMSGQTKWLHIGAVCAVLAIAILAWTNLSRPK